MRSSTASAGGAGAAHPAASPRTSTICYGDPRFRRPVAAADLPEPRRQRYVEAISDTVRAPPN